MSNHYPTYQIGIQLNFPIRNRVAQADVARDELSHRAYQTRLLQLENQAQLEAEDAIISLRRSRAAYLAAVRTRALQANRLTWKWPDIPRAYPRHFSSSNIRAI